MTIHTGDCSICLGGVCFGDFNTSKPNALRCKHLKGRKVGNIGERLKCGHMYHRKCILPWFLNIENEMSETCPMCRQDIRFSNRNEMLNWRLFSQKQSLCLKKQSATQLDEAFWDDDDDESELSSIDDTESEVSGNDEDNYHPRYSLDDYEQIFENHPFQDIDADDWAEMIQGIRSYFSQEEGIHEQIMINSHIFELIMRVDNFLEDNQPMGENSSTSISDDESDNSSSSSGSYDYNLSQKKKKTDNSFRCELRWVRTEEKAYRKKFYEKKPSWRPTHFKFR